MEKQTLILSISINAPKEKIWDVLLQDHTYRQWTSVFHPGSYAETDWKQGSKVLFKNPEGNGLVSKIVLHKPAEVISIEHLGILKNGIEDFENEEVKSWQGFTETYHVTPKEEGKTELTIQQDITKEHAEWFTTTWGKALQKVKELSEININAVTEPFVIERSFNAPVEQVWKAITDKEQMKQWYFDINAFKPEVGFEFNFIGQDECVQYMHLCRITEVVPLKKLSYTWHYKGYEGSSTVTFELFQEGNTTRLKLTHEGLETFPANNSSFTKESFASGWTAIIGTSLSIFLKKLSDK